MRRTLFFLCVLALAGCPSEPDVLTCRATNEPAFLPLLVAGTTSTLELISPLGFCEIPLSARRATLELLDEQGQNVPLPEPTLTVAKNDGLTRAQLAVDLPAGLYQLRAVFEPSLGVLTQQVVVATDLRSAGLLLEVPTECAHGPFVVSGHVLCATSTQVLAREGSSWRAVAELATNDTEVAVAEDVLWAAAARTSVVERYAFSDAGVFTRTHVGRDLGSSFGEVRRDFAIRGALLRPEVDGGLSHEPLIDFGTSQTVMYEGDAGFRVLTPAGVCGPTLSACRSVTEGGIWGITPSALVAEQRISGFRFDAGFGDTGISFAVISRPIGPSTGARLINVGSNFVLNDSSRPGHTLTGSWGSEVVAASVRDGLLRFFVLGPGAVRAEQADVVTVFPTATTGRVMLLK